MTILRIDDERLRELMAQTRLELTEELGAAAAEAVDGALTGLILSIVAAAQPPASRLGRRS